MSKKTFILSLLIFIFALSIRIYFIGQKQGFHVDEIFSLVAAKGKLAANSMFLSNMQGAYKGKNIKNFYFEKPTNTLLYDLKELRKDNYGDDAHPSLYYSALRCILTLGGNTPQSYIYYGCGLNILFFIFSFFIMGKILLRLFGDNKLVPIGLGVAFLNTGTISTTLFIRPYELQMLAFILFSFVYLLYVDKFKKDENIFNIKDGLIITLSLAFVFLSGYLLALYAGILGLVIILRNIKNLKNILALVFFAGLAVGVTVLFYTGYFGFLGSQRFNNVTSSSNTDFTLVILSIIAFICNLIKYLFYSSIILTAVIALFFREKISNSNKEVLILIGCAFIWALLAGITAPYKVLRYIAPSLPIISLILIYLIQSIKPSLQKLFCTIFILLFGVTSIFPLIAEESSTSIQYNTRPFYIPFNSRLENLYMQPDLKLNTEIPVFVENNKWYMPLYIVSFMKENQTYYLNLNENNNLEIKKYPYKHFYLFADSSYNQILLNNNELKIKKLGKFLPYKCYEIEIKNK